MQELQFYVIIITISILLGTLLVFLVVGLTRLQQRKKEYLHKLNILAQVTAMEKDRASVTHNLHEEFGATLSVVKMGIGNLDLSTAEDQEQRERLKLYLDDVITKIRAIAFDFLPYTLQRKKLVRAIEQLISAINKLHPELAISLTIDEELPEMSEHKTVNVYRILQEIVDNTIQHAKATSLFIRLKTMNNTLLLSTWDNGIGFHYQQELEQEKGLGLNNMLNRVLLLNGSMEVDTKKGGTLYQIKIPI
jgi:signal transduction histidine kinase